MDGTVTVIKGAIDAAYEEVRSLQENIHMEPEVSNNETKTRAKVKDFLKDSGLDLYECRNSLGLIYDLKVDDGLPTIAFRGDMDALSIGEKADVSYRSREENVMHACGHDFHTSILAGTAKILSSLSDRLKVNVRFIFQPAEENNPEGGAKRMIAEGALEDCSAIFGLHLWPELNTGTVGLKAGPILAASDRMSIEVTGRGAHAAKPEAGVDAVVIASHIVVALQSAVSRGISPLDEAVVTIGRLDAGCRYNIIADKAQLQGTVRNTSSAVREELKKRIFAIAEGTAAMFGGKGEVFYADGFPVLENDADLFGFVKGEIAKLSGLGISGVELESPSMIAEDFSFYAGKIPGFFMLLGCTAPGTEEDLVFPLHSAFFKADQRCIRNGLAAFLKIALGAK